MDENSINKYNSILIDKIKHKIKGPIIETLEEILPLSREAIYRRLRGAVVFSYPEVAIISQKLHISLDDINRKESDYYLFKINKISPILIEDSYANYITFGINNFDEYIVEGNSQLYYTGTNLPMSLSQNYDCLLRFRYFKWLHENRRLEINQRKFSKTGLPVSLHELSLFFFDQFRQIESTIMLSDMMIENYIKEIKHFISLDLIEREDIRLINESLHDLMLEFEQLVATGKYKNGANVSVYLTDINMDSTFGYLDKGKQDLVFTKMFGMNYATCQSKELYSIYKAAFEDLKDYATLITQSGSARRTAFFRDQHKLIDFNLDVHQ